MAGTGEGSESVRFARQVLLPGVGLEGHRRLVGACYRLSGDPAIVEPAVAYIRAAGCGDLEAVEDGTAVPGHALCRVVAARGGEPVVIRAVARPSASRVGSGPLDAASPLADAADLAEAGMLLAIESLRAGLGLPLHDSWGIAVAKG